MLEKGQTYTFNFPGFPVLEGVFRGEGGAAAPAECPDGWWAFQVRDNSYDRTTHAVFVNPALVATVIPKGH
jgi:hypothetical protein